MGKCPDYYPAFQAAKYLNVAIWDLMDHCIWYQDKALVAMTAENQAQKILSKRKQHASS